MKRRTGIEFVSIPLYMDSPVQEVLPEMESSVVLRESHYPIFLISGGKGVQNPQ